MTYIAYVQKSDPTIRLTESEMENETVAHLNGTLPVVTVAGVEYEAGDVLAAVDPRAFRAQVLALVDAEFEGHEFEDLDQFTAFLEA